jgi:hypothetical protein
MSWQVPFWSDCAHADKSARMCLMKTDARVICQQKTSPICRYVASAYVKQYSPA